MTKMKLSTSLFQSPQTGDSAPEMKQASSPKSAKGTPKGQKKEKTPAKVPSKQDLKAKGKSQTPQPKKAANTPVSKKGKEKTPKSEPQIKTKKLKDEIDEELSDEDFENLLAKVAETEKLKRVGKLDLSKVCHVKPAGVQCQSTVF